MPIKLTTRETVKLAEARAVQPVPAACDICGGNGSTCCLTAIARAQRQSAETHCDKCKPVIVRGCGELLDLTGNVRLCPVHGEGLRALIDAVEKIVASWDVGKREAERIKMKYRQHYGEAETRAALALVKASPSTKPAEKESR